MMAADEADKHNLPLSGLEPADHQIETQASGIIESNFLKPLEDSQETQAVTRGWCDDDIDHGIDVAEQPLKLSNTPFISRPKLEDPMSFQDGFQYSRPPAPKIRPFQLNLPGRPAVGPQSDSRNSDTARIDNSPHSPECRPIDAVRRDQIGANGLRVQGRQEVAGTGIEQHGAVSIPKDSSPFSPTYRTDQPNKQDSEMPQNETLSEPPFQSTPPLGKLLQQPKTHTRSRATELEKHKLPKSFSDIQRRALIQSNHTTRRNQLVHYSKSHVDEGSPSRFKELALDEDVGDSQMAVNAQGTQFQEILHEYPALDQPQQTLKAPTLAPTENPRKNRRSAVQITRPISHEAHDDCSMRHRPISQASNISKPRAPQARKHNRSQRKQMSPNLAESNALRDKLGRSWNSFFLHEAQRNEHWEEKMMNMTKQLAERDDRIGGYLAKIQQQDQVIEDLQNSNLEQQALCQKQKTSLTELETRRQRLKGKMKEYKDRLNDVTKEQQSIFKYFQPRYHQMREDMERAEKNHQESLEQALSAANTINGRIQKSVEEVKALSQEEIKKCKLIYVLLSMTNSI
ncbi:hypothetical protein F5B17DRAFT_23123 [Nemania serpens]|nr:hypothetical protein F5B17DRAFT_23123 [Nemania serpens]